MRRNFIAMAAALALATSSLTAPAQADEATTPLVATEQQQTNTTNTQVESGSSNGEVAALVVGSIVAVLALVGAGAFWAMQQGLIVNPLKPAPQPQQPAPRPQNQPRYQSTCSDQQILQPAKGPNGEWLVCVSMGRDHNAWVYGPEPLGVGTAKEGEYCTRDGGQDTRGRMMMCLNNRWIYGP